MTTKNKLDQAYFQAAKDWYFDRYEAAQIQASRWFVAFLGVSILAVLLTIAIFVMMPLKTLVPLVVHQNTTTGEVWVDRPKTKYTPANDAQIQADIVRYITARESYSATDINQRFHLVMLLSSNAVGAEYANLQSNSNKQSPVNVLEEDGTRTVHIESIVFIDQRGMQELRHFKKAAHNLAQVDFTTTTTLPGKKTTNAWVATIEWQYQGLPESQAQAWENWNGFNVVTYRLDPRNIDKN